MKRLAIPRRHLFAAPVPPRVRHCRGVRRRTLFGVVEGGPDDGPIITTIPCDHLPGGGRPRHLRPFPGGVDCPWWQPCARAIGKRACVFVNHGALLRKRRPVEKCSGLFDVDITCTPGAWASARRDRQAQKAPHHRHAVLEGSSSPWREDFGSGPSGDTWPGHHLPRHHRSDARKDRREGGTIKSLIPFEACIST